MSLNLEYPGWEVQLLVKAAKSESYKAEFDCVTDFYGSDLNAYLLNTQLQVFSQTATSKCDKNAGIVDVVELLKYLSPAQCEYFSEVCI